MADSWITPFDFWHPNIVLVGSLFLGVFSQVLFFADCAVVRIVNVNALEVCSKVVISSIHSKVCYRLVSW